jgi:hypothetical protein
VAFALVTALMGRVCKTVSLPSWCIREGESPAAAARVRTDARRTVSNVSGIWWNQTIVRCTTRPAPRGVRFTPPLPCTNPCIKLRCPIALMHAFDAHSVAWIR